MSMKRLRNVAVRMRPPSPASGTVSDIEPQDRRAQHEAPSIQRQDSTPAPQPTSQSAPKRHIWDLEADGADALPADPAPVRKPPATSGPLVLRQADLAPPTSAQPVPVQPAPEARIVPAPATPSAEAAPSRAKTRIIGFRAPDEDMDSPAEVEPGPAYPAGFLVVIDGPGRGAHFTVTTRVSSIGRSKDQDICLDFGDESISREGHASVMYDTEQNAFFLGHGNKANAVRRNNMPVLATEMLEHGDDIRIGKTTMRFHAFCGPDFTWEESDEG